MERGLLVGDGEGDDLLAQVVRRLVHSGADHHRARRADGRGDVRQIAVAELVANGFERQPERVGGDLGHHRPDAGAELRRSRFDYSTAVAVDAGPRLLFGHEQRDWVAGGGHAVADQPIAVSPRSRRKVPLVPAEQLCSAAQTLGQAVARPGVAARVVWPVVHHSQLHGVDLELLREFVHGRLEHERGHALTRTRVKVGVIVLPRISRCPPAKFSRS